MKKEDLNRLWILRKGDYAKFPAAIRIGLTIYMFISSAIDFFAHQEGIVNAASVPSIIFRVLIGIAILMPVLKSRKYLK